ncbi:MAG: CopG family transcriptional regulator [Alphaproteobacteria bacterium]|nr:CopG family transcriptional regulator [Alphaproteobacteria bacterium]
MNLSIYLPSQLSNQLSLIAKQKRRSKSSIVKEALEEWLTRHRSRSNWPPHFFDFEAVEDAPDFSIYRKEFDVIISNETNPSTQDLPAQSI